MIFKQKEPMTISTTSFDGAVDSRSTVQVSQLNDQRWHLVDIDGAEYHLLRRNTWYELECLDGFSKNVYQDALNTSCFRADDDILYVVEPLRLTRLNSVGLDTRPISEELTVAVLELSWAGPGGVSIGDDSHRRLRTLAALFDELAKIVRWVGLNLSEKFGLAEREDAAAVLVSRITALGIPESHVLLMAKLLVANPGTHISELLEWGRALS